MKTINITVSIILSVILVAACTEESDLAIERVAAPLIVDVENTSTSEITATFYELDKSGILDYTVGIDSVPVTGLSVEVFAANTLVGIFTTDANGAVVVAYTVSKPNEYAGTYKGVAFRIKK